MSWWSNAPDWQKIGIIGGGSVLALGGYYLYKKHQAGSGTTTLISPSGNTVLGTSPGGLSNGAVNGTGSNGTGSNGTGSSGNTNRVPDNPAPYSLEAAASHYGVPLYVNTHGQTGFFYAGQNNGISQIAKYNTFGKLLQIYAAPNLTSSSTLGSLAGGTYKRAGTYSIP